MRRRGAVAGQVRLAGSPAPLGGDSCRACPSGGGTLHRIGEKVTETLDYLPGRFKVIRHCTRDVVPSRDTVVAASAPDHAIARGRAGTGLLGFVALQPTHLIQ